MLYIIFTQDNMGIPAYFSYIIKNHPKIITNLLDADHPIDHFYMDCNSIIYDIVNNIKDDERKDEKETREPDCNSTTYIIQAVIQKIHEYILYVKPEKTVFITFDGVAPFAKMEQQKNRRYKSYYLSQCIPSSNVQKWNICNITPGTVFMETLMQELKRFFIGNEKQYNLDKILISGSDEHGEGEHKIFNHIRNNNHENDIIILYGLDADLIMLSLFHIELTQNIYIMREAPEFIKSSCVQKHHAQNIPLLLNIYLLHQYIIFEMNCKYSNRQSIFDYIFICFLLGNDFLPAIPCINIRTHGINVLLDIYRHFIGNYHNRFLISQNKEINWQNVKIFLSQVAKQEHELLLQEYSNRNKLQKTISLRENDINNIPILFRAEELYICPTEQYWEDRYYHIVLDRLSDIKTLKEEYEIDSQTTQCSEMKLHADISTICMNYLQGLEWVFKYYTDDCINWRWKYNYMYPPLLVDFINYIPKTYTKILDINHKSFSKYAQLAYVLPKEQLHLLPTNIHAKIIENYEKYYTTKNDIRFAWAFKRYFWESHIIMTDFPLQLLETLD